MRVCLSRRRPRRTSTCCAGRAATRSRSRWWSSRPRACCAIRAASRRCRSWRRAASSRCSTTPAPTPARVRRVVLTSGKLYYDLLKAREDAEGGPRRAGAPRAALPVPGGRAGARRSRATPRPPSWCGRRRSRATWAPGASCASSSWTARAATRRRVPALRRPRGERRARPPARTRCTCAEQEAIVAEALRATAETPVAVRQAAPATS